MRELVILRDGHCVFPWCPTDARGCDQDHIDPYVPIDDGGPPGQTHPENLAPLCRRHHRCKTSRTMALPTPTRRHLRVARTPRPQLPGHTPRHHRAPHQLSTTNPGPGRPHGLPGHRHARGRGPVLLRDVEGPPGSSHGCRGGDRVLPRPGPCGGRRGRRGAAASTASGRDLAAQAGEAAGHHPVVVPAQQRATDVRRPAEQPSLDGDVLREVQAGPGGRRVTGASGRRPSGHPATSTSSVGASRETACSTRSSV